MKSIRIYDSTCNFFLGDAYVRAEVQQHKLPEFVLWHGRIYRNYHSNQYREIIIEPAFDKEDAEKG